MEIDITELRGMFDQLMRHVEHMGPKTINVPHDYYWSIPKQSKYNPYAQPSDLSLGQLSDDVYELRQIATGKKDQSRLRLFGWARYCRRSAKKSFRNQRC